MKTKEQILDWLDKQPWKGEFYESSFLSQEKTISYDKDFLSNAFNWAYAKPSGTVWAKRNADFIKWYENADKPMSWEEYCKQNQIKEKEKFISGQCRILDVSERPRNAHSDVNVMPRKLCKAFLAYMKLIQLRNAWVKDCENGDKDGYLKIVYTEERGFYYVYLGKTGLSFPTSSMAEEFINTFKDLLEVAKPLL